MYFDSSLIEESIAPAMMKIFTKKKTNMKFLTSKVKKKIIENTKQAPILMILPERSKNKDDIKRSKTSLKI